ncbi:hypothetical protein [Psychrobacter pygoscelis]|uniref:hypothetical protein n=1 Tax=Psychrobacter pygoscelis TaxID=2488563 RepID=UPI00103FD364|nr:hypothetical protein [Psychrobacter pygoscelis]
MSNSILKPSALSDAELIDDAINSDDILAQELARRLEYLLPCEPMCSCEDCLSAAYTEYQLEALSCGYDDVAPEAIENLVELGKSCIIGVLALIGYQVKNKD